MEIDMESLLAVKEVAYPAKQVGSDRSAVRKRKGCNKFFRICCTTERQFNVLIFIDIEL